VPLLNRTGERTAPFVAPPLRWLQNPHIPRNVAAALAGLSFREDVREQGCTILRELSDAEWEALLEFTHQSAITLVLGASCRKDLPAWVRDRIDRYIARNTERLARLRAELALVSRRLESDHIEFVLLKGFSLGPEYTLDPRLRMHYDFDLFVPEHSVAAAYRTVLALGYEPLPGNDHLPTDHLPTLTRKTGWQWRGDPFDPEIPPTVELHFRFWDSEAECLPAPGVEEFWPRRVEQDGIPVLHSADRLTYSALHLLRHLFRGSARVNHVYEIARFLETHAENDAFWSDWRKLQPEPLRRLQAVAFRLAAAWFGCHVAPEAAEQIQRLTGDVPTWFENYTASPIEALFYPNKHELWLHLALLDSSRDRRKILLRKIFPLTLPAAYGDVFVPDREITFRARWKYRIRYAVHLASRTVHHARTMPVMLSHAVQWKWRSSGLEAPFWWFTIAQAIYALGVFMFYLLYNLYLLDRGYHEDALGYIASALTLGSVAGILPAAGIVRRLGLTRAIKISILGTPAAFALRCLVTGEPALVASALLGGAISSLWAVSMAPAVAALTSERSRPLGFSMIYSSGIGVGMLAGLVGGRLPGWMLGLHLTSDQMHAKQITLLASVAFAALGFLPMARLRMESGSHEETSGYPRSAFVYKFLTAIGVWSLATGAFNPLFNAYFERRFHMPLENIGIVFAFSHAGQVATILLSPLLLRKLGLVRGVVCMQLITALALGSISAGPPAFLAAAFYVAYMSFQYMGDPGTNTLLMNQVEPGLRSGAAALSFLVAFLAQALAASAAGAVVARYGYPPMLLGATLLAVVAAWLFSRLKYDEDIHNELLPGENRPET
jgi:predicted MFS family arabinose efflux permease